MCIWGYENGTSSDFQTIFFAVHHSTHVSIVLLLESPTLIHPLPSVVGTNCHWSLSHRHVTIVIIVNSSRSCSRNWLRLTIITKRGSSLVVDCFLISKLTNRTSQVLVDRSREAPVDVGLRMSLPKYVEENTLRSFIDQEQTSFSNETKWSSDDFKRKVCGRVYVDFNICWSDMFCEQESPRHVYDHAAIGFRSCRNKVFDWIRTWAGKWWAADKVIPSP